MPTLKPRRIALTAVVTAALVATFTGCGGGGAKPASAANGPGLATRTAKAGPVEVSITPRQISASGARFGIELDNHAVELNGDYAKTSTLTVNGRAWPNATWSGAGPGGHHRSGTLTFAAAGPATGAAELRLGGLPAPVTVRWTLPAG